MRYKFILLITTVLAACATSNIVVQEFNAENIIHYSQMENTDDISNYAIYLDKGDTIKINMTLDSELAELANEETYLVLKQKIYFRIILPQGVDYKNIATMSEENKKNSLRNIMIFLSANAKNWAPYTDIRAVKQLFGLQGGSFSVGMGVTKEEGLKIQLHAATISSD